MTNNHHHKTSNQNLIKGSKNLAEYKFPYKNKKILLILSTFIAILIAISLATYFGINLTLTKRRKSIHHDSKIRLIDNDGNKKNILFILKIIFQNLSSIVKCKCFRSIDENRKNFY